MDGLTEERRVVKIELVDGSVRFGDAETGRRSQFELGPLLLVRLHTHVRKTRSLKMERASDKEGDAPAMSIE